ncbi:unnamed protein product [Prunus armeniaca]
MGYNPVRRLVSLNAQRDWGNHGFRTTSPTFSFLLSPSIVYGLRFLPPFFYAPASASALSIVYSSSLAFLLGYRLFHTQKCWILSKQWKSYLVI